MARWTIFRAAEDFFLAPTSASEQLVVVRGRDPHFPAWIDTGQLNAFIRAAAGDHDTLSTSA